MGLVLGRFIVSPVSANWNTRSLLLLSGLIVFFYSICSITGIKLQKRTTSKSKVFTKFVSFDCKLRYSRLSVVPTKFMQPA